MSYQRRQFWTSRLNAQQESLIRRFIKITLPHAGANAPISWVCLRLAAVSRPCTPKSADELLCGGKRKKLDYVGQLRESSKRMEEIDESWILDPFQAWIDSRLGKDAN